MGTCVFVNEDVIMKELLLISIPRLIIHLFPLRLQFSSLLKISLSSASHLMFYFPIKQTPVISWSNICKYLNTVNLPL